MIVENFMSSILDSHLRAGKLLSAYLFVGTFVAAEEAVARAAIAILGLEFRKNPDYYEFLSEKFGIGEVREVIRLAGLRSLSGIKKVFFLNVNGITMEAANALLKIIEEPPEGTYFFLRAGTVESLPPTLRSRLVPVFMKSKTPENGVAGFFNLSLDKRLTFVRKLADGERREIEEFFENCERYLEAALRREGKEAVNRTEEFLRCKELFFAPVSYNKAILEGVSIALRK